MCIIRSNVETDYPPKMDTLTTAIGGALLAKALPEESRGPSGVWIVTLASAVPDIDVFADLIFTDPLSGLTQHRGFTHSLVGIVVIAPLIAGAFRWFSKNRNFLRLLALALLGLAWHLFTDLATSWGTMVFYPFSRERVVWDLLFIIDFSFTAILVAPHLVGWVYAQSTDSLRRGGLIWALLVSLTALAIHNLSRFFGVGFDWRLMGLLAGVEAAILLVPAMGGWGFRQRPVLFPRVGVGVLGTYLAVCTAAHFIAVGRVERMAREKTLTVRAIGALPQPFSPFRWSGLALTPEGVYQGWFNVLESTPADFRFFPSTENGFVARARELPEVQTYLWFARFPVARYRREVDRHIVEYADQRFQSSRNQGSNFAFRVIFDSRGRVLSRGFAGQ